MEPCRFIFALVLIHSVFSATVPLKKAEVNHESFTSELGDGFVTLPKAAAGVENADAKFDGLDKKEKLNRIPDADEKDSVDSTPQLKEESESPKPPKVEKPTIKPVKDSDEPVKDKETKPIEFVVNITTPKPDQEAPAKPEDNKKEDDEQQATAAQSDDSQKQEVTEETGTTRPNIIQQGLLALQQGIQNITSGFASIVNGDENSSPPNILQNIQQNIQQSVQQGLQNLNQTVQNIVNPPLPAAADEAPVATSTTQRPGFLQQGITNFQQGIQQGIRNLTQAFQGFVSPPASEENSTQTPGFLQSSVQNLQQGIQQGLQNLNQTFQSITNPDNPNVILNITNSIQILNPIAPIASDESSDTPAPSNIVQQTINNLQSALQQGIQNLNQTIQNILNPQATTNTDSRPSIIQQGIEAIQGLFRPRVPAQEEFRQQFGSHVNVLNETLHEGIKNITTIAGIVMDEESSVESEQPAVEVS